MTPVSIYIPGADQPAQTTQAARLRRISDRAKASEQVLALLSDLAFGSQIHADWQFTPSHLPQVHLAEASR